MLIGSERAFLVEGCKAGIRADGRGCLDWRPISVDTGVLQSSSGSAQIRIGATDVLVGVKTDLGTPDPERPNSGRVQFSVEVSPCAGPALQGRPAEALAASLTKLLERSYGKGSRFNGLDMEALSVVAAKKCWVLYVDALILGVDGSLADATSLAVKAALADTEVPLVSVIESAEGGDGGGDAEIDIDDDPEKCLRLDVSAFPLLVTLGQVGEACLADLTAAEEACSGASVQAAVDEAGTVSSVTKQGLAPVSPDTLLEMMRQAQACGPALSKQLGGVLGTAVQA